MRINTALSSLSSTLSLKLDDANKAWKQDYKRRYEVLKKMHGENKKR